MTDKVAEAVAASIADQDADHPGTVIWHGGEPLALPIEQVRKRLAPFDDPRRPGKGGHSGQATSWGPAGWPRRRSGTRRLSGTCSTAWAPCRSASTSRRSRAPTPAVPASTAPPYAGSGTPPSPTSAPRAGTAG